MKKVSNNYKRAMQQHLRNRSYMVVTVGIINNEAQASARVSSQSLYISNNKGLFKDAEVNNTYATFEDGLFKLDGSMILAPEETGYEQLADNTCFISKDILGSLEIVFDKPYSIKGLTINFGEYYPTEFTVNGDTYTNDSELFTCTDSFNSLSSLVITPVHFVGGDNKRLRINSIRMGIGIVFQNEDIENASFSESASFISEELPQMDFSITCFDKYQRFRVDDSNSFINYLETGQEIYTSIGMELEDGSVEFVKLPLTYLSSWSSNNEKIAFTSVDRFAFLTGKYSGGNTIHSRTLYDDAVAVLTDAGLEPDEYEITDILRSINVVNPLPEVSYAECLQLIANAGRCLLKQNESGMITLAPNFENILEPEDLRVISDSHVPWSIPDNIKQRAEIIYADFTNFVLDGSLTLIPDDTTQYIGSGYVSEEVSTYYWGYFYENLLRKFIGNYVIDISLRDENEGTATVVRKMPIAKGKYILSGLPRNKDLTPIPYDDGFMHITLEANIYDSSGTTLIDSYSTGGNAFVMFEVANDSTVDIIASVSANDPIDEQFDFKPSLVLAYEEDSEGHPIADLTDQTVFDTLDFMELWSDKRPKVTIQLPTLYTYYTVKVLFTNAIRSFRITIYNGDTYLDSVYVETNDSEQKLFNVVHNFENFNKMEIEIYQTWEGLDRVAIEQFSFGDLSEYKLKSEDMNIRPVGTVESKTQSVSVRVFTFQDGQNGEQPQALDDNVFETYVVNPTGETVTFENQLISDNAHALEVAEWIANYYGNNVTYNVMYRGEPRIEAADYLFMDSDILNNLQVEVEEHTLEFSGSIKGQLKLRRANNIIHS